MSVTSPGKPGLESAPLNERMLEVLKEAVSRSTSARSLSEQLGHAHNYVRRLLSGEIPLQMETLLGVLSTLGFPPELFFEQVFQGRSTADPVAVLKFYREGDGLPRDPFLDEIEPRIESLQGRLIDPYAEVEDWSAELEQLEERRFEDREGAKDALEALALTILDRCEALETDVPSQHVADLARACSIWAVIQRVAGYRDNSCDMYIVAFRLLERVDHHDVAAAVCYQRAAYLMLDLDAKRAGLHFLRTAENRYLMTGETGLVAKVLVDKGLLFSELGESSLAAASFKASLKLLPTSSVRNRATAHSALARILEGQDRLSEAADEIRIACELYSDRSDIVAAQILVLRGRIARKLELDSESEDCFLAAIKTYESVGHPGYVLLAALEYAELLLTCGRTRHLAALADEMFGMAKYFRKNRIIDAAVMEFVRMAKWGELTEELLQATRSRLESVSW